MNNVQYIKYFFVIFFFLKVCALRHITSGHAEVENAQNSVCRSGGVQVVAKLLQPSSHWPLIKAVIGLIKNIAQCKATHGLLREHSAIHNLVGLSMRAFQDLQNVIFIFHN